MSGTSTANWRMTYLENPLQRVGRHGVILVYNNAGAVHRSYEGFAYSSTGVEQPIGFSWAGDTIRGVERTGRAFMAQNPGDFTEVTFFEGTQAEVQSRMAALNQVNAAIYAKAIPYVFPGALEWLFGDSGVTNSNTVIRTYFEVLGVDHGQVTSLAAEGGRSTIAGRVGQGAVLLSREEIEAIAGANSLTPRFRSGSSLNNSNAPRCFLAGTPILMADGQEKPIEDIRVGDLVMSFDPSADQGRGALVPKPVSRTFQNITRSIIDLRGLHMTPGHVCLTDDGRFETIAEILLRDGILVEADGTRIRARTGAKVGSMEDTPVLIAYPDEKTGKEIFVRARAGIPCRLIRERDGTKRHLSLALMLRAYHQTLTPEGLIQSPDGSLGEATDWPEDSTPMDEDYRRNWVIQTADGKPYVPEWIQAVAEEAREEQTVGATLQRIISPPSQRFAPKVVDNPTPPARNRAERRAQKHRGPK